MKVLISTICRVGLVQVLICILHPSVKAQQWQYADQYIYGTRAYQLREINEKLEKQNQTLKEISYQQEMRARADEIEARRNNLRQEAEDLRRDAENSRREDLARERAQKQEMEDRIAARLAAMKLRSEIRMQEIKAKMKEASDEAHQQRITCQKAKEKLPYLFPVSEVSHQIDLMPEMLAEARKNGAKDEDVFDYLISKDERYRTAKQQGYTLDEIAKFMKQKE